MDVKYCGIRFGNNELVLFDSCNKCYSLFGDNNLYYEINWITRDEYCGGEKEKFRYNN